jgi:hypothetical protein
MKKSTPSSRTTQRRRRPKPRLTILSVGRALVAEMKELMDRVSPDDPNYSAHLMDYFQHLYQRHPDWQAVIARYRQRQADRMLNPAIRESRRIRSSRQRP